jgi:hypothetical protein
MNKSDIFYDKIKDFIKYYNDRYSKSYNHKIDDELLVKNIIDLNDNIKKNDRLVSLFTRRSMKLFNNLNIDQVPDFYKLIQNDYELWDYLQKLCVYLEDSDKYNISDEYSKKYDKNKYMGKLMKSIDNNKNNDISKLDLDDLGLENLDLNNLENLDMNKLMNNKNINKIMKNKNIKNMVNDNNFMGLLKNDNIMNIVNMMKNMNIDGNNFDKDKFIENIDENKIMSLFDTLNVLSGKFPILSELLNKTNKNQINNIIKNIKSNNIIDKNRESKINNIINDFLDYLSNLDHDDDIFIEIPKYINNKYDKELFMKDTDDLIVILFRLIDSDKINKISRLKKLFINDKTIKTIMEMLMKK